MSTYFDRLGLKLDRQKQKEAPPPADTSSLGAAIEQLIDTAVEERVADALERQKPYQNPRVPPHLRDFTDKPFSDTFPPPPPMAKPVKDLTVSLQRNEVGRVKSVSIGQTNFIVQRDGEGRVVRMVPQED